MISLILARETVPLAMQAFPASANAANRRKPMPIAMLSQKSDLLVYLFKELLLM